MSGRTIRPSIACCVLTCGLLCASAAQAQIYAGVEDGGTVVLSNFRSSIARELVAGDGLRVPSSAGDPRVADSRYGGLIDEAARQANLSPGLLHAVISVESGFNARAVSPKGAKGLMQLMPSTAAALGVTDPFDPRQNIAAGAAHLKSLLDRFDNNLELALAAYNAGADAVVKAGYQVPRYAETRSYVPRVMARLQPLDTAPPAIGACAHRGCDAR